VGAVSRPARGGGRPRPGARRRRWARPHDRRRRRRVRRTGAGRVGHGVC